MGEESLAGPNGIRVSNDWICSPHQLRLGPWWDFGEADTILSGAQVLEPKARDYVASD